jgi:hypothetical protein
LVGVLILLALTSPNASMPLLDATSARSLDQFGSCFTTAEERRGRSWAFLPSERGGTFTDAGAQGSSGSYWLQARRAGAATRIRLFAAESISDSSILIKAVEQCR